MIIPDNRDEFGNYAEDLPVFGPAPTALLEGMAQETDLEIHIVSCARKPMYAPNKLGRNIFFHLLLVRQWGRLRSAYSGCILAIRKKLQELKPDIVHGQGTERYCALAAVFSGFPNVTTIHGNMRAIAKLNRAPILSYQWCAAKLEQITLPRTDGVICLSEHTQALTRESAPRTWLIPNAVTNDFFNVRPSQSASRELLCVGTISALKNQNSLIRALDPLAERYSFKLIFLGDGVRFDPYVKEFLRMVEARPWCVHTGFVNTASLQTFLSRATALVLPSLEDNCPMVILEAAAAGVPVMAARVGGIPSLIKGGQNGLLFDPYNVESISMAAERYLADSQFARQMADNARALAETVFRPTVVSRQHMGVYREVVDLTR